MNKPRRLFPLISIAFIIILAIFMTRFTKAYEVNIVAMDTVMSIKAYGPSAEKGIDAAVDKINSIDKSMSVTNPDSAVSLINASNGTVADLSGHEDVVSLISKSVDISRLTGGSFDITIYPIVKAWGFTADDFTVPEDENIKNLLKLVDYEGIMTDGSEVRLRPGQMIDLGAIAKGYAADQAAIELRKQGIRNAIINLGGNVLTMGKNPETGVWKVGIKNPVNDGSIVGTIEVSDKAVVTSGNSERYFEKEGVRYWHIIDPKTGYPADAGLASLTIISDSATYADAMSTAGFVMGLAELNKLYEEVKNFEYIAIDTEGNVITSPGAPKLTPVK